MINLKASARATRTCYRTLSCMPILVVLAVSAANGQSLGAGAIEGTIVDDSGAALPGVTVTAAGPALQVPQVLVVSGPSGTYRFPTLPAGVYLLRYSLPGFQTVVRQDLRLNGGFVATINIEMRIGAIEEALTVVGQSPVVDVRTTSGQTNLTQEMLDTAPVTRTMWNVLAMAPGMRVAQDVGGAPQAFSRPIRATACRDKRHRCSRASTRVKARIPPASSTTMARWPKCRSSRSAAAPKSPLQAPTGWVSSNPEGTSFTDATSPPGRPTSCRVTTWMMIFVREA